MSKWDRWPWRKLYIPEEGSFAMLPLYARALGGYLLKFADDQGRIHLGGREPWDAVARRAGAERSDRRLLKTHIPLLIEDGYLAVEGEYLVIRNLPIAQATKEDRPKIEEQIRQGTWSERDTGDRSTGSSDTATGPRPGHDATTMEQRRSHDGALTEPSSRHDGATTGSRPGHDGATKGDLSDRDSTTSNVRREEKRREEKYTPLPPVPESVVRPVGERPSDPLRESLTRTGPRDREDVQQLFAEFRKTFGLPGAKLGRRGDERPKILADAIDTHGLASCLLVLRHAKSDDWVNGKADDRGQKHETVDYIFGKVNTFERILKAAHEAESRRSGGGMRAALVAHRGREAS